MIQKHHSEATETQDLDDKDLETVTGGLVGGDGGCIPTPWKKKSQEELA